VRVASAMSASQSGQKGYRLAASLIILVLLLGLAGTIWFYRVLQAAESASVDRQIDYVANYVELDVMASLTEQLQAQQRMVSRLAHQHLADEPGWRSDIRLFWAHHPYYRTFVVTGPDLRVRWQEGGRPAPFPPGEEYPVDDYYRPVLSESALTGALLITRPARLSEGNYELAFIYPILAEREHLGYLISVMGVNEAVDAMVSDLLLDGLSLRVTARDEQLYPPINVPTPTDLNWQQGFEIDLDGDGDAFLFEFGINQAARRQLESLLPAVALAAGVAVSVLVAVIAFLGLNARFQASVLGRSNRRLEREVRERELAERELEYLVTHDPLTGLPNRTGSTRFLERVIQDHNGSGGQLALLFLDLDQFKDINDSLGHELGDQLLCEIAPRLTEVMKDQDFVGRHGGDEFLIAVSRSNRGQIEQLAINILRAMDTGFAIDGNRFFISASIGIAYFPESGSSVNELIQNADTALFKAKNAGRNQFAVFTREMFSQAQHRLNLSRDIRQALDAGQFSVVYQPIVSTRDTTLCGLEALLRWQHEKGYMVPPQEFIRIAEETGVIGRLGDFVMERALSDLAHWQTLSDAPPWLAVNISGAQVREAGFAENLSVLLHQHKIQPELLHLEITEEILIENLMRNRRALQKLDEIGMRIVVDDFGVGYSSLAYLKNFPISVVKIDRGFIKGLASDPEDQAITRTICSLSSDLGMLTVAEGVEQPEQLELLRQFRCSFVQGYLFSRPVPAAEVEIMLTAPPVWKTEQDS
jgi:diguanylate cyclase (GGDEF)-like protein